MEFATCECPQCFLNYVAKDCLETTGQTGTELCDYCAANPNMSPINLLNRRIDVMKFSRPSAFPDTFALLVKILDLRE